MLLPQFRHRVCSKCVSPCGSARRRQKAACGSTGPRAAGTGELLAALLIATEEEEEGCLGYTAEEEGP